MIFIYIISKINLKYVNFAKKVISNEKITTIYCFYYSLILQH